MDLEQVKNLYIQGFGSLRTLAKEHQIPYKSLCTVAKNEGWATLKKQAKEQTSAYPSGEGVLQTANCLLAKMFTQIMASQRIESGTIKQYTSALKDLRDIMGVLTPAQLEEHLLKLENLRQKNQKSETVDTVTLQVQGGEESWVQ